MVRGVTVEKLKILVMDDEDIVRNVAGKMLEFLGYQAILARDGEAAVRAFQSEKDAGGSVSAVLLDWHVAAGMGGLEAFRRLRLIDPQVKVILSSGYPERDQEASRIGSGFAAVIAKPYALKNLRDTFDRLGVSSAPEK